MMRIFTLHEVLCCADMAPLLTGVVLSLNKLYLAIAFVKKSARMRPIRLLHLARYDRNPIYRRRKASAQIM